MTSEAKMPLAASRLLGRLDGVVVGLLLLATFVAFPSPPTRYDNYNFLADAIRQGRLWIEWPGERVDAVLFHGHYYVVNGPVPALFMLPASALFGLSADQRAHCILFAAVAGGTLWYLLKRFALPLRARALLFAFFVFGTSFYWCAMYGDVWFFAHIAAVAFTFLALNELLGARRAWLVAVFGVLAAGSRQSLALALPVYAAYLALTVLPRDRVRCVVSFALPVAAGLVLWIVYDYARWSVPGDLGYTLFYHADPHKGSPTGSPFGLHNVPMQLFSFFVLAPQWWPGGFPWLIPTGLGVALTWTSPGLVFAAFAREPRALVTAMWSAVILVALPSFLYFVNGFVQFGMRHALDFEPFLLVLMALAAQKRFPPWAVAFCVYSVVVGLWGVWFWRTFFRR